MLASQGQAHRARAAPRAGSHPVGLRRHGPHRRRPAHALTQIPQLREEFWQNVSIPGEPDTLNKNLEYAGRVADYLEFGEVLAMDALERRESCGGHFREENQTPDNEALARRRAVRPRRRLGVSRARIRRRCATSSRWNSSTCTRRSGATSEPDSPVWRQARRRARPAGRLPGDRASRPTCRSSRCWTSSTKA